MTEVLFSWQTCDNALQGLADALKQAYSVQPGCILLLASEHNHINTHDYNGLLKKIPVTIFGGIYPGLLWQEKVFTTGYIVIAFKTQFTVTLFDKLTQSQNGSAANFDTRIESQVNFKHSSYLLFSDALSPALESFIDRLYYCLGAVNLMGSGAGTLSFKSSPCIFTNQGVVADAAQLVALPSPLNLCTGHGWEIMCGPFLVTDSQGHQINSFNYKPAAHVYWSALEQHLNRRLHKDDFANIVRQYPLGIQSENKQILVRDPIQCEQQSLICVGNIPNNSLVYILSGEIDRLIQDVYKQTQTLQKKLVKGATKNLFVINCVSRHFLLQERFSEEIHHIHSTTDSHTHTYGVLSIGEVANDNTGAFALLNKSAAIGAF